MPRLTLRLSLQLTLSRRRRRPPPWQHGDADDAANDPPETVTAADIAARLGVHENLVEAVAHEHGMLGRVLTTEQAERIVNFFEPLPPGVA